MTRGGSDGADAEAEIRALREQLADSQARLRAAMALGSLGMWEVEISSGRRTYSEALLEMLQLDASPTDAAGFYDLVHPDDRAKVAAANELAARDGTPFQVEIRIRRRLDGVERYLDAIADVVRGADGRPSRIRGVARDVTDARRVHQQELEAQAQLRAVLDHAPIFICYIDRDGKIRFINRTVPELAVSQVIGTTWRDYTPPEQQERMGKLIDQVLATGEPASVETRGLGPGGELAFYSTQIGPVLRSGEVVGVVMLARDTTEQKRTEAQLITSDRMAAVGVLAAGVAHEINNPLTAVVASLDLALRDLAGVRPPGAKPRDLLVELAAARDAAWRIGEIVRDLRIFSRAEDEQRGPVDVRDVLASTLRMAWNEIRHRARLVTHYDPVPRVDATESRLGQVFLNLIVNAAQAIPEGHVDDHEIRVSTGIDAAGRVRVEIADTGAGMSADTRSRLFTPFFTTKPAAIGTGLGLAICQRIVSTLGGEISVTSELGRGSCFTVCLPPDPGIQAATAPVVESPGIGHHRGRILVVDDEAIIATALTRMLSDQHEVAAETSARAAVARMRTGERFDVVLCDLMMPDMTGMELHEQVRALAADQAERFIFMTGGAFTPGARAFLDGVRNPWIEKPFDPARLLSLIDETLTLVSLNKHEPTTSSWQPGGPR